MTLSGVDLSSNNSAAEFADALASRDFAFCKATEGVAYLNPTYAKFLTDWHAAGKLLGTYHFARPANDPTAEADWYVAKAQPLPGEVLVLDFEPYGQTSVEAQWATWCVTWLQRVKSTTGADPWIYFNDDMANRVFAVATAAQATYLRARPLWKAAYQATIPSDLEGFPVIDCWQWTDTPTDQDLFYGDAARWRSLGVPPKETPMLQADIDAIVKAVLDAPISRQGAGWSGTTSLRTMAAYSDSNLSNISAAVKAISVPAAPAIDYVALAKAVNDDAAKRMQS